MFRPQHTTAQINEAQLGAWYMYLFKGTFGEGPWGIQGDIQHRNWNLAGDLEQLMLRGGIIYQPQGERVLFTLGYANITTGTFGPSKETFSESRIYQEVLYPVQFGTRIYTMHRFRYEQRFVEGQSFRTRYRYNLFINIPLNQPALIEHTLYLSLYNELFINGQRDVGNGQTVEIFDRNRLYGALGYVLKQNLRMQIGLMNQTTNNWSKNQLQFSVHHTF